MLAISDGGAYPQSSLARQALFSIVDGSNEASSARSSKWAENISVETPEVKCFNMARK